MGYFAWAKRVVDGFTAPNPALNAEFDQIIQCSGWDLPSQSHVRSESKAPISRMIGTTDELLAAGTRSLVACREKAGFGNTDTSWTKSRRLRRVEPARRNLPWRGRPIDRFQLLLLAVNTP
jgi:hypothetical protein